MDLELEPEPEQIKLLCSTQILSSFCIYSIIPQINLLNLATQSIYSILLYKLLNLSIYLTYAFIGYLPNIPVEHYELFDVSTILSYFQTIVHIR